MRRLGLVVAVATLLSIACREQQPLQAPGRGPSALIVDGANNNGNPDFFFLPPLASDPSSNPNFDAGAFDPNQRPAMEVYRLPSNPTATCPQGVRVFGPVTSVLVTGQEQYLVSWNTDQSNLVGGQIYRICMFATVDATTGLHGTLLGFVDVEPVDKGVKNVRTDDVAEFQNGRTIPVKTRVEKRAYCKNPNTDCVAQLVVASDGGTVLAERAGVLFGPGVLPGDRVVVIEEVPLKVGERCLANRSDLLEYSPCYSFRTDPGPTSFTGFATAAVCPDLSSFPNFTRFRELFQEEHVDGLTDANGDFLPCTLDTKNALRHGWRALLARLVEFVTPRPAFAATALIDEGAGGVTPGFSRFVNAVRPRIDIEAGQDQTAVSGTQLPVNPSVRVTAMHFDRRVYEAAPPLVNVPVTFTPSVDGSASPVTMNTDEGGMASASWTLARADGGNSLVASVPVVGSASHVTFSANGMLIATTATDPAGDAASDSRVSTSPDLTSATATADGGNLMLSVRFAPGTFNSQTTQVEVLLDTDRNPATGSPGSDAGGVNDAGIIGVDYLIRMGSAFQGTQADVFRYAGTPNNFTPVGSATVAFVTDGAEGMDVTIPLSLIGNDDGQFNFKVTTASQISSSGFTGVLDYMPNVGLPAAVLVISPPIP